LIEDDGYTYLSPEYNEALETRTAAAMAECQDDCGDCTTADPVVVSGSDAVTSSSSTQYTASGGIGPYTWSVSGTGATIDETGLVTLDETACGGFTVTATDTCGVSDTQDARVTDNGHWVTTYYESAGGHCYSTVDAFICLSGFTRKIDIYSYFCRTTGISPVCSAYLDWDPSIAHIEEWQCH
jgi:hypothetical protein